MDSFLSILLGIFVLAFVVRVIYLWILLWRHYREMKKKYAVSIWKLPATNLALMNDEDKKATKRLYWKYVLNVVLGMIVLITSGVLLDTYLSSI